MKFKVVYYERKDYQRNYKVIGVVTIVPHPNFHEIKNGIKYPPAKLPGTGSLGPQSETTDVINCTIVKWSNNVGT